METPSQSYVTDLNFPSFFHKKYKRYYLYTYYQEVHSAKQTISISIGFRSTLRALQYNIQNPFTGSRARNLNVMNTGVPSSDVTRIEVTRFNRFLDFRIVT